VNQRVKVAIGLGANLGDRLGTLAKAATELAEDFLEGAVVSSVYESPPWGVKEQPDFLNAVIVGESEWRPPAILNYLKDLESRLGRKPGPKYGPRIIDLDILAYGETEWSGDGIEVPHPRLTERDFVLLPLKEVWPGWRHPRLGRTVETLCADLAGKGPLTARSIGPLRRDTKSP
jgi:2-amino-4-hydroxy-6-hydroxymethyldihydropteridine diphosphokinase